MALTSSVICFFLSLLLILVQARGRNDSTSPKSFSCGHITDLSFPFYLSPQSDSGLMSMSDCEAKPFRKIQLVPGGDWYYAFPKPFHNTAALYDTTQNNCQAFNKNISLLNSPSISFTTPSLYDFFKCNSTSYNAPNNHIAGYEMYNGLKALAYTTSFPDTLEGTIFLLTSLYEHKCKRMEQFVNEIDILTRLRYNNLVTLYGCTSRRSRELLLVYEYVPNGTLADHLHGDRMKDQLLTWPVRMNIAIETAGALAYLHASDVIHCDVKTNNILHDHNCSVKVADFGISRLFSNDVSHISTAPRGTPGYIDPKYHECYQLTSKSNVYNFGVVLVELISAVPAVDMNMHTQEINLSNFAINKIIRCAFNELIDPSLGLESDTKIWVMTTSVAELAFPCL
ncbi:unnamed protein product [Withania somnifera]